MPTIPAHIVGAHRMVSGAQRGRAFTNLQSFIDSARKRVKLKPFEHDRHPTHSRRVMTSTPNGHRDGSPHRRFQLDGLTSNSIQAAAGQSSAASPLTHSGRRFVLGAGIVLLLLWGALYLIFRDWRARYNERARFGATQVAPVIDALADTPPPDVTAGDWRRAVRETHDLLVTVTGSNLLDRQQMLSLRRELEQIVARAQAHPETARDELAGVWNLVADRAEFVFRDGRSASGVRHIRPTILPPRPENPAHSRRSAPRSP